MSTGFNQNTWYVLHNAVNNDNNTLTAANNTQQAFNSNSPSSIFYAPFGGVDSLSQQWQIVPITASSSSAYIIRNRQLGSDAYLTTAWSTRKCGGGSCATVPVMAPYLNNESLWNFEGWGFSDSIGGATIYNLGNTSSWRLDTMLNGPESEIVNTTDTGQGGQHWFFSSYAAIASSDASSYSTVPTTATALLAQFTGAGTTNAPTIASNPAVTISDPSATSPGASNTALPGASSSGTGSGGLSSGASAGIGVGVAVAVIGAIIGAFLLFRRYRRTKQSGTSSNPVEMGQSYDTHSFFAKGSVGQTGSDSSTAVSSTVKGPVLQAEMASPSQGGQRVELYSPREEPPTPRYEMPHPSNSPRMEMEHPSTRDSTTVVSSTDGLAGSGSKGNMI